MNQQISMTEISGESIASSLEPDAGQIAQTAVIWAQCEQCRQPFEPRKGSGGKPQRFCSAECRTAFHNTDRPNVSTSRPNVLANEEKPGDLLARTIERLTKPDDRKFDWDDRDVVVVPTQPAIAVYFNTADAVVIRQESPMHPDEDSCVFVQIQNLGPLISILQEIAAGKIKPGEL